MLRSSVLALVVAAAALALAPAALGGPFLDRAATAFENGERVYVDPGAERTMSREAADRVEGITRGADGPAIVLAVLPSAALAEASGSAIRLADELGRRLNCTCTIGVVAGGQLRAASSALKRGDAARFAALAERKSKEGLDQVLIDFVKRANDSASASSSGGRAGTIGGILGSVALVVLLLLLVWRRRRSWGQLAEVRRAAGEDLAALAADVDDLEHELEAAGADAAARGDHARAAERLTAARAGAAQARKPAHLRAVAAALEDGRYAVASARARLAGEEPPERRPPCFFDARHGPSAREVEWSAPGEPPRRVPACDTDARRIEAGHEPETRELVVDGRRVPYWSAPPHYGGFFGGAA